MKWLLSGIGAFFCLAGCGGSSSGTFNVFTGTWSGSWREGTDQGTATFHITGFNSVAGSITDTTTGQTYQLTGSITNPSSHQTGISITESNNGNLVVFNGTITQNSSSNAFQGTLTDIANSGDSFTINLSLTTSG